VQAAFPLLCQVLRSFSTNDYVFSIGFIQEGFIFTLEGLAALAIAQGEYDRAASLFGWAEAIRQTQDIPRPPVEQASVEHDLAILRSHLADDAFEQAYQTGQALTLEQVMASALEIQVSS
jgi:hypothetical protein